VVLRSGAGVSPGRVSRYRLGSVFWACRLAFVAVAGLAAASCGVIDRYQERIDQMNRSVNEARNEILLLNIARAEHNHPLTFFAVTSVSGSHGANTAVGLPDVTFGPAQTVAQGHYTFKNNSVSGNASTNIQVSPLESREFYQGLLQPIGPNAIQFFVGQGYPRQIIFLLTVESIRLKGPRGEVILWNDPSDSSFPLFMEYVHRWIDLGVSVEEYAGRGKKDVARVRLCFDRGRARLPLTGLGPICGSNKPGVAGLTGLRDESLGPVSVTLQPRSTYGVFRYLGRLLNPELGDRVLLRGDRAGGISFAEDRRLFPVQHGAPPGICLTRISYNDRDICVPATGAEQGPMVLQLLAQLIALNTSVRDLPLVPAVRVTN